MRLRSLTMQQEARGLVASLAGRYRAGAHCLVYSTTVYSCGELEDVEHKVVHSAQDPDERHENKDAQDPDEKLLRGGKEMPW